MNEIPMTLSILIGFILEITFFFVSGMMFAFGYPLSSMFYLVIALCLAWYTGDKIQKGAVSRYKRENEK